MSDDLFTSAQVDDLAGRVGRAKDALRDVVARFPALARDLEAIEEEIRACGGQAPTAPPATPPPAARPPSGGGQPTQPELPNGGSDG